MSARLAKWLGAGVLAAGFALPFSAHASNDATLSVTFGNAVQYAHNLHYAPYHRHWDRGHQRGHDRHRWYSHPRHPHFWRNDHRRHDWDRNDHRRDWRDRDHRRHDRDHDRRRRA